MAANGRARTAAQKAERAGEILVAVRELLADREFGEVSVQEIADRAGVAKGTIFLYYATKETLGLALLEELLAAWWDDVEQRLSALNGTGSPSTVAAGLRRSLEHRDALLHLLAMMSSVLEANAEKEAGLRFRRRLREGAARIGKAFEQSLAFLRPGDGMEAALTLHALLMGIHQLAARSGSDGKDGSLDEFRVDVPGAVGRTMRVQLEGARAVAALGAATAR